MGRQSDRSILRPQIIEIQSVGGVLQYTLQDYEGLSKALVQPGVTMQLLWEKYVNACWYNDQLYYRLTQFKKYFNDYLNQQSFHLI